MHDCADGQMRDLLPGYVNKTLSAEDHAAVDNHLATCDDCVAEIEVIEAAVRAFAAPQVNIAKIVKALPATPRSAKRSMFAGTAWRVAAAIGVVLIGAGSVFALRGFFVPAGTQTQTAAVAPAPAASATLATTEPVAPPAPVAAPIATAATTNAPAASSKHRGTTISFGGGLSDLSDAQLDALMSELDALDSIPSAEPETHLTPIVPMIPQADGGHHAQ